MFDSGASTTSSYRPLPLKQRTSSVDTRRDYTHGTWRSVLILLKFREFVFTVDNFSIWRRHLAWAIENGKDLRTYISGRYASNMVFMSLLLSTELGVLFNSAAITDGVRTELRNADYSTVSFWAGFMIIVSSLFTLLGLFSTFTAWAMVNAVDECNAHCIFRSSIGQYAAELPGRFIVGSIYTFLIAFFLFFFLLLPVGFWSVLLLALAITLFVHVVATFSALGRVIMHTGAMGKERVFDVDYESTLLPHSLHTNLLAKARANLAHNTSITRQYRKRQAPIDRHYSNEEALYSHLTCRPSNLAISTNLSGSLRDEGKAVDEEPYRRRSDSLVRFADEDIAGGVIASSNPPDSNSSANRAFTPLSDLSSPTNFGRQPSDTSQPLRSSSGGGNGPSAGNSRPPRPKGMRNSPFRSSSSSLEQWLQASASPSNEQDLEISDGTNFQSPQPRPIRRSPPPPLAGSGIRLPKEIRTHQRDHSAGMSSIGTNDRLMSEDDQFLHDYGGENFVDGDNDSDETPIRQTRSNESDEQENGAVKSDIENQGERASLLASGAEIQGYNTTQDNDNVSGISTEKPKMSRR